jgi:hypothetical protein
MRTKSVLDIRWQTGDRLRELAGHLWIGEGRGQAKQPQPGGRYALGSKAIQIGRPLAGKNVTQQVVVDDDGCHLRGGQFGIIKIAHEPAVLLGRQSFGQEPLAATRGQEYHNIAQVDHSDPSTMVQAPPMADGRRHRHLSTG